MICIIALFVFGIMGIFSATHRRIAKEALDCVFRRVTFRPCTTGLDKRLRAELTGHLLKKNPKFAKWVYARFEIISWAVFIIFIVSTVFAAIGIYNFTVYGDCNGPNQSGFCPFNPGVGQVSGTGSLNDVCAVPPLAGNPRRGPENASLVIVEFGCFTCPNTAKMVPVLKELQEMHPDIALEFRTFPIDNHAHSVDAAIAAECAFRQGKFWEYHDALFANSHNITNQTLDAWAEDLGLDMLAFGRCRTGWVPSSVPGGPILTPPAPGYFALNVVQEDIDAGMRAKIYGTPTIFINDSIYVGVQPLKKLDKAVNAELTG
jgi:protein-disulfide isomerase